MGCGGGRRRMTRVFQDLYAPRMDPPQSTSVYCANCQQSVPPAGPVLDMTGRTLRFCSAPCLQAFVARTQKAETAVPVPAPAPATPPRAADPSPEPPVAPQRGSFGTSARPFRSDGR